MCTNKLATKKLLLATISNPLGTKRKLFHLILNPGTRRFCEQYVTYGNGMAHTNSVPKIMNLTLTTLSSYGKNQLVYYVITVAVSNSLKSIINNNYYCSMTSLLTLLLHASLPPASQGNPKRKPSFSYVPLTHFC